MLLGGGEAEEGGATGERDTENVYTFVHNSLVILYADIYG